MDNIWWWYIFRYLPSTCAVTQCCRYFETNVPPCPLPREYSLPLPSPATDWLAGLARGRSRLQEEE